MVSGFVTRRWLRFWPLLLLVTMVIGCGMMSVLVDEDAAGDSADAGSTDASEDAPPEGCGDGIIQGWLGEACEAGDTGGATCSSLERGTGTLGCNDHCQFDFSLCTGGGTGDGGVIGDGGFRPTRRDGGPII